MADGISGALDSVLNSPLITTLAPIALGVLGGLGQPGTKWGGGLGKAMQGGAEGLQQAQQTRAAQQRAMQEQQQQKILNAHTALQDQLLQGQIDTRKRLDDLYNQQPPDVKQKYPTADIWHDAMAKQAGMPNFHDRAVSLFNSAQGKAYMQAQGFNSPDALPSDSPQNLEVFKSLVSGFKPEAPDVATAKKLGIQKTEAELAGTLPPRQEEPGVATERNLSIKEKEAELAGTLPARPVAAKPESSDVRTRNLASTIKSITPKGYHYSSVDPDGMVTFERDPGIEGHLPYFGGPDKIQLPLPPVSTTAPTPLPPASAGEDSAAGSASRSPAGTTSLPPSISIPGVGVATLNPAKQRKNGKSVYSTPDGRDWPGPDSGE